MQREIQDREEAVEKVRLWLDQSQLQLQHSQEELNSREQECKLLRGKVGDQQHAEAAMKVQESLFAGSMRLSFAGCIRESLFEKFCLRIAERARLLRHL